MSVEEYEYEYMNTATPFKQQLFRNYSRNVATSCITEHGATHRQKKKIKETEIRLSLTSVTAITASNSSKTTVFRCCFIEGKQIWSTRNMYVQKSKKK